MESTQSTIKQEYDNVSLVTDTIKEKLTSYLYCAKEPPTRNKAQNSVLTERQIASLLEIKSETPRNGVKIEPCTDVFELKNLLEENNKYIVDSPYRALSSALSEQKSSKIEIKGNEEIIKVKKMEDLDFEECTIEYDELNIKEEEKEIRNSGYSSKVKQHRMDTLHCEHCEYKTTQPELLDSHLQTHNVQYKCKSCEFKTTYKNSLKRHLVQHGELKQSHTFHCDQCDYKTPYNYRLKLHSRNHNLSDKSGLFKCTQCRFVSDYKHLLKRHINLKHRQPEQQVKYKCDLCDFQSVHRDSVNRHLKKHKSPEEVTFFKCTQCDYKSIHKRYLKPHLRKHQSEENAIVYKCDQCEYQSLYKSSLARHLAKHNDPGKVPGLKCNQFDYRTPYKRYLQKHLFTHKVNIKDEDMFRCEVCNFKTKRKDYLSKHQLRHKKRGGDN